MHLLKVLDLPFGKFRDKGVPIDNLSNYSSSEEDMVFISSLGALKDQRLLFITRQAMIKLVDGAEFDVSKRTTAATKLGAEDELLGVIPAAETDTLVMQSEKNMFLRISVGEIPQKKKAAIGVRGMKLSAGDLLSTYYCLGENEARVIEVKEKEVHLNRLHVAGRDTKGVKK